jgi:hypothetical protein
MKKNLRIVSAAAAALLTVAPVAASAVSTPVFADTGESGSGTTAPATDATKISASLSLANPNLFKKGTKVSDLNWNSNVTVDGKPGYVTGNIRVYDMDANANKGKITKDQQGNYTFDDATAMGDNDTLQAGHTYIAAIVGTSDNPAKIYVNNAIKSGEQYSVNGETATAAGADNEFDYSGAISSSPKTVHDSTLPGAPFFMDKNDNFVTSGSVDPSTNSVRAVVAAIKDEYEASDTNDAYSDSVSGMDDASLTADVRAGLAAGDVTLNSDGDTYSAASSYLVNVTVTSVNDKKATLPITVHLAGRSSTHDSSYPVITFDGDQKENDQGHISPASGFNDREVEFTGDYAKKYDYVPLNGNIDKSGIESLFSAQVSGSNSAKITPSFDFSKVDTKVAGAYKVPVTATNPDGKKTTFTLTLHVGAKDAVYKQVTDDAPIYTINGNKVSSTKDTVPKGTNIATFDTVTLGGKSYTRINSEDSNQFVESKYLSDASTEEKKTSKKIMHNAYIYDKDHNRVGKKMLAAYTNVDVYGEATKDSKGNLVYKIGDNQYVMADNITGTVRTLSHNSYVYATSKKRANNKDILAGTKVTTYGSPYTFKNGKSYYRVGGPAKQYIKVVNFAK